MSLTIVVALTLLPTRMRTRQAEEQLVAPRIGFEGFSAGGGAAVIPATIRSDNAA